MPWTCITQGSWFCRPATLGSQTSHIHTRQSGSILSSSQLLETTDITKADFQQPHQQLHRCSMQGGDLIWANASWPESKAPSVQVWGCSSDANQVWKFGSLWFECAQSGAAITSSNWSVILKILTSLQKLKRLRREENLIQKWREMRKGQNSVRW